jgi:MFS family permease
MAQQTSRAALTTRPWLALSLTTTAQIMASIAMTTPSVLAPIAAPELGFAPQSIGVLVSAMYLAAIGSGLIGGHYVRQFGALRLSQVAMLLLVFGLLLAVTATATVLPLFLMLATLSIGIGYGLTNPTSAQVLSQHASERHRGLIFSIKQTGVPIGVALAGLLIPIFLGWFSWRGAVVAVSAVIACELLFLAAFRKQFDHGLQAVKLNWADLLVRPLKRVLNDPPLRSLAICSGCYAGMQVCFLTFLVSDLKLERGFSLAAAAGALATAQITSIAARPFWGVVADRYVAPRTLLGLLGLGMAATLALFGVLSTHALPILVIATAMLVAATVVGWNGVFFAGIAQQVPSEEIAMVIGGTQFITFGGAMICPLIFAASVTALQSYSQTFLLFSVAPFAMGIWLLIGKKHHDLSLR